MENLNIHTYQVGGMSCGGCVSTVKYILSSVLGVTAVKIDRATKQAEITSSQKIALNTLQDTLKDSGYTISELKA